MSGLLLDSTSHIIGTLLKDLGVGSNVSEATDWPIYRDSSPDSPYSSITVYETAGPLDGKTHTDGETQQHYGFQIRVRTADDNPQKMREISNALDGVFRQTVIVGGTSYLIQAVHHTSSILSVGRYSDDEALTNYTCNFQASITKL